MSEHFCFQLKSSSFGLQHVNAEADGYQQKMVEFLMLPMSVRVAIVAI
jgi:hypothetical protein